ncbi:MAG: PAS domain-containing protein, partial [bacterium]
MNPNFHTFQNVQGMLLVTDKNSKVIWINNECRETLGFIEKNLVGKRLYDICLDSTKLQKAFDELSPNTAKNLYTEFKFDGKSGNNILVVNLFLKNFKLNNKQYISVMLFIPERHNPLRIIYRYIVDASCLAYL